MTKWVPAVRKFDDFYNMLDDFFTDPWVSRRSHEREAFRLDVRENENIYEIEAELPGVGKDEIDLSMEEGKLTIRVNREEQQEDSASGYIHRERRVCSMQRSLYLKDAGQEGIRAKLEDGILKIAIPKIEPVKRSRLIEIE